VGASVAALAAATLPGAAGAATSASKPNISYVRLSATPLGLDVGPWDTLYSDPTKLSMMQSYLKAAGIGQLHYGGGGTADQYDWENNTVVNNPTECTAAPTPASFSIAKCAATEPFDFAQFSTDARGLGAQSYVSVDYGTGTPDMAAAWVTQADATAGQGVAQWGIGNESYGCWENDWWLTQDPLDDTDYVPNGTGCPWSTPPNTQAEGVQEMADSFATNALPYMTEMTAAAQAAGQSINIGIPWAFDGTVGGAGVPNNAAWDKTILDADGQYINFVDAHWYPFGATTPGAQTVLQSVETIPAEAAKMHTILNEANSKATITIGETGVSYLATDIPCIAAGAPFAAGDVLEWLSSGAATVDWWPMETGENAGSACNMPEEAMFTGNGTPDSVYYGYLLASQLAQPNAQLSALTTGNSQVLGFQALLPNGQTAVELINTNTGSSERVALSSSLSGSLTTQSLAPTNVNAIDSTIVTGTTTATAVAGGVTLPKESILVLKSHLPTQLTMSSGATDTFKPGAKVTLTGKLTLHGAAAPAGTTVKVYRRLSGSTVNSVTMTTTTGAGGTFTVSNTPPGRGNYSYVASYAGTSLLASASCSYLVHVPALKPALKLTVSATSVKPGRSVTVTATLGATHGNRTVLIYAQIKGGGRKLKKRANVNAKGQLSIVFPMKVNTTFSVSFLGDNWYGPATATAVVKA
jgi:hypothetical protein